MSLEKVRAKLNDFRANGSKKKPIPDYLWKEVAHLASEKGVGFVGKELSLHSVRIRFWAKKFNIELPRKYTRKNRGQNSLEIIKLAPLTSELPATPQSNSFNSNKIVFEIKKPNGLTLSIFEASTGKHFQLLIECLGGLQ